MKMIMHGIDDIVSTSVDLLPHEKHCISNSKDFEGCSTGGAKMIEFFLIENINKYVVVIEINN